MKRFISLFTIAVFLIANLLLPTQGAAAVSLPGTAPVLPAQGKVIFGHYIVILKDGGNPHAVAAIAGVRPTHVYEAALNGFAAQLNVGQLKALQQQPGVAYIEQDQQLSLEATQSMDAVTGQPWGLDRIDQKALPLSKTYTYNSSGSKVHAYIIDTGIEISHPQFKICITACFSRAQVAFDALGGNGQDCHSHGTHVAGTVGGTTYGVAKFVWLYAVRVFDCVGNTSLADILEGINWVKANAKKPAVANLSFGGPKLQSVNDAVKNLSNSGVFVAVAAGNDNIDACTVSPASVAEVYTVAASDKADKWAVFPFGASNWGTCVDGYAPGKEIESAGLNGGKATKSGTSMAAPHVAGVAALYKHTNGDASQATINSWINTNATPNVIQNNKSGTPNRLLYKAGL